MTDQPLRFTITLVPTPGTDGIRALHWLLKRARRQYGLIAIDAREEHASNVSNQVADAFVQLHRDVRRRTARAPSPTSTSRKDLRTMSDNHTALHQQQALAPAQLINPLTLFAQRNRSAAFFRGPLIKCEHTTGEILRARGETKTLVEPDERFTTNPHLLTDVWTRWINGRRTDQKVYRAINGEMAPTREELGDNDESEWPVKGSKPKDPWQRQVYLPMRGNDGEVCAFSATGQGAIAEIAELVGLYASADRGGKFPVVEIATRSFESTHGSTIYVPVFRLVDWEFWTPDTPAPEVKPVPLPIAPPPPTSSSSRAITKANTKTDDGLDDTIPF